MRKKKHLKIFAVMFTLIMALCMSTVIANAATKKSQTITASNKTVYVGLTKSIGAKASTSMSYKSSNTGIVTVSSSGVLTGKKEGTAYVTITAKATTKYKAATKKIKVAVVRRTQTITASNKSVYVGSTKSIEAKASTTMSYASSNTSIVTVDSKGVLTGKKAGTAYVTIKAKGTTKFKSTTKKIKVTVVRKNNSITASNVTVNVGATQSIGAKACSTMSYTSSNTSIVTVNSKGVVTGKKVGKAYVTIKAKATTKYNSLSKKILVTVVSRANNSITSVDSLSIPTGTTKSLSATGKTTLSYASSNTAVATVDSKGNVKGIKAGTATITIKAKATTKYNSLTKKVTVTVYDRADNSITCPDSLSIPRGTYKDLNATGKTTLSYSSSDTSVATVDSTGRVEGLKNGTATITIKAKATSKYNSLTKKVTVTVYTRQKNEITVSGADSNGVYHVTKGTTINMSAKGKTTLGYASEDTSIATVDSNGNVTGIAAGTTTIIISAQETDEYNYLAKEVTVVVTEPTTPTPIPTEPEKPAEPETPTVTPTPIPTKPEKPTVTPTPVPVEPEKPEEPSEPIVPETPTVVSTETVHHNAVTHTETVIVKEAWTEEVPIYETRYITDGYYCNTCGEEMSDPYEHFDKTLALFDEGKILADEIHNGWHSTISGTTQVQVGTETVTHPAETEVRTIVDQKAYDEVTTTYSDGTKKTEKVACVH